MRLGSRLLRVPVLILLIVLTVTHVHAEDALVVDTERNESRVERPRLANRPDVQLVSDLPAPRIRPKDRPHGFHDRRPAVVHSEV